MPSYATAADLDAWLPATVEVPADVDAQLRRAGRMVRAATLTAVYETNPATDLPLDPVVRNAFRDAVCAQVETWVALGVNPSAGPAGVSSGVVKTSGIGGASVGYEGGTEVQARQAAVTVLADEAQAILSAAGLLGGYIEAL